MDPISADELVIGPGQLAPWLCMSRSGVSGDRRNNECNPAQQTLYLSNRSHSLSKSDQRQLFCRRVLEIGNENGRPTIVLSILLFPESAPVLYLVISIS